MGTSGELESQVEGRETALAVATLLYTVYIKSSSIKNCRRLMMAAQTSSNAGRFTRAV